MASTAQAPPPAPPPMRPRPPRSLAGPVVLILIGLFFLLGNMGVIQWHHLGYWFAHYWPALLILWGIIKLIEYQNANRAGYRSPGIGAGGILLILILVVAGLSAHGIYAANWNWNWEQLCESGDADLPWCGHKYEYTADLQQAFPSGSALRVNSEHGAINVSVSNDSQLHLTVHKHVNAERQSEADNWDKSTQPKISASSQVITIDANTSGGGDHWVSSDLDISLPRKAAVTLSTRHGDVSVIGRDGVADVTSADGEVSVSDLNGALTLHLDKSSARVSQVSSDVAILGRANDVAVEDVKGAVRLDGDFMESVKLSRIAKPVSFKSTRTDMDFTKLDGELNLDSGDLEASSLSGPLHLRTRSKDVMLNGVTSDVHLQDENGAIEIHLSRLGSVEINNSKGDIRIYVPQKSGFTLDAQASDGEIETDFNSLKVDSSDDRATASGSVNGGGPRMVVRNEHGNIEIRSGSVVSSSAKPGHANGSSDEPQETEN